MENPAPQVSATMELPSEVPVMVLDGCYLFPGCFLPLFIFEDRYRKMLDHALAGSRMFCVGSRQASEGPEESIYHTSTIGLVRASVKQDDGTSHLMLYGLQRVKISGWKQEAPFRIGKIEAVQSVPGSSEEQLKEFRSKALEALPEPTAECAESMQVLRETLDSIDDPERVCDILSYHFIRQETTLQRLLTEPRVDVRYSVLLKELAKLRD
jgi:ATP-dependent Lon protease